MANDKLNGSVDLLAQAMRKVFVEATEVAVEPLRQELGEMKKAMITQDSLSVQLHKNRKDVVSDVKAVLRSEGHATS